MDKKSPNWTKEPAHMKSFKAYTRRRKKITKETFLFNFGKVGSADHPISTDSLGQLTMNQKTCHIWIESYVSLVSNAVGIALKAIF